MAHRSTLTSMGGLPLVTHYKSGVVVHHQKANTPEESQVLAAAYLAWMIETLGMKESMTLGEAMTNMLADVQGAEAEYESEEVVA